MKRKLTQLLLATALLLTVVATSCRTTKHNSVVKESLTTDSNLTVKSDTITKTIITTTDSIYTVIGKTDSLFFRGLPENRDTIIFEDERQKITGKKLADGRIKLVSTVKPIAGRKTSVTIKTNASISREKITEHNQIKRLFERDTVKTVKTWCSWWWILALLAIACLAYRLIKL